MKRKLRVKDMAKLAGVSTATVSRALNPETAHMVLEETRKHVAEIALEHNYVPNIAAKQLRQSKTKTIGLVYPAFKGIFDNAIFNRVLSGVSDYLLDTDYRLKLIMFKYGQEDIRALDFNQSERVDGLIIWSHFYSGIENTKIDLPTVYVNDYVEGVDGYFVCGDNVSGARKLAAHLFELGHRNYVIIAGNMHISDTHLRINAFKNFLFSKGVDISEDKVYDVEHFREDLAYELTAKVLKEHPQTTAIFALSDDIAIGVIRRLNELDIACPDDISVVGYDDNLKSIDFTPSITTIRDPLYELVQDGAKALIGYLSSESTDTFKNHIIKPGILIARSSSAPVKTI